MRIVILISILILGLTSCSSYKNLSQPPKMDTEGIIRDDVTVNDTTTIANIPWKEYFKDAVLQDLIAEGLQKNADMQIALSRIRQAKASLSIATGERLPSLAAGAEVNHTRTSSGDDGEDVLGYTTNKNSLGFSASWEIDLWGKLNNQARAGYANYLNSYEYKNLVQTELIASIANAYYNLLALDEQLRITKETIVSLDENAQTMSALKEAGQQNAASVEQSNALLYNTQISIFTLESAIRELENSLCIMLNRKPGPIERTAMSDQTVPETLDYGVPAQLLAKRPDVRQAELNLLSSYAVTDAARASFYPSLTISSATLGYVDGNFSNFFTPANLALNVIAGLTQPIFNKNKLTGNLEIAKAQQEQALVTFSTTVLSAGKEVSDILFSFKASLNKNELREKQINSLTNSVDYTHELLVAGEANYTEVLSAEQSLLSAQLSQVDDKLEQLTLSVNLYRALGGGVY